MQLLSCCLSWCRPHHDEIGLQSLPPARKTVVDLLKTKTDQTLSLTLKLNGKRTFEQKRFNPETGKEESDKEASIALKVHKWISIFLQQEVTPKKPIVEVSVTLPALQITHKGHFIKLYDCSEGALSMESIVSLEKTTFFIIRRNWDIENPLKILYDHSHEDTYTGRILNGDFCGPLSEEGVEGAERTVCLDTREVSQGNPGTYEMVVEMNGDFEISLAENNGPEKLHSGTQRGQKGTVKGRSEAQKELEPVTIELTEGKMVFNKDQIKAQERALEQYKVSKETSSSEERLEFKKSAVDKDLLAVSSAPSQKKPHQRKSQILREAAKKAQQSVRGHHSYDLGDRQKVAAGLSDAEKDKKPGHQQARSYSDQGPRRPHMLLENEEQPGTPEGEPDAKDRAPSVSDGGVGRRIGEEDGEE